MTEVNETEATTKSEVEEGSQGRRRHVASDNEPGIVRIKLPLEISNRVREAISELKLRGVNATAEELLAEFIGSLPGTYLMDEVLRRTPEEFYIRAAIQIPELREKLARQARKALVRKSSSETAENGPRRQRKTRSAAMPEDQHPGATGIQA